MNPYQELDVPKDATDEEIKSAYHEKAKIHHPDKGGDSEKFKKANDSYQILISFTKRRRYDQTGETKEENTANKLTSSLVNLFDSLINQNIDLVHNDMFKLMENSISNNINDLHNRKAMISATIDKHEKVKKRIKKGEIFHQAITAKIKSFKNQLFQIEEDIDFGIKMIEELKNFEYEFEEEQTIQFSMNVNGGNYTNITSTGF